MKVFSIVLFIGVICSAYAAPPEPEKKLRTSSRQVSELQEMVEAAGGCNVNICFALDGSGSVTELDFFRQRDFVIDVMAVIAGNPVEAAAVQFGTINRPISFLTADQVSFIVDVDSATFSNDFNSNVGGGIVWCSRQLNKREDEARKIVVLTDGRNTLGGSPVRRANRFRNTGGKVCSIGIGFFRSRRRLLRIAGGDPDLVLTVNDYEDLADILAECVEAICGIVLN